jgi:oligopeptide/dipeptide ABC transporter ATP-binding protein
VIRLRDLRKHYRVERGGLWTRSHALLRAVDGVNFTLAQGESLGLVGESGSGKSTIGQMVLGLVSPTSGSIEFDGQPLPAGRGAVFALRGQSQVVFQDPYDSLNPRQRVREIVSEPLRNLGSHQHAELERLAVRALERVGLHARDLDKFPHQFSGGQRQRIGIARAISVSPRFIVLDEPVSALDVSIQAQVVNLLMDIRREQGIAFLFISHNLAVVEHSCDRIVVLYLGKIMEIVPTATLHAVRLHPYTRALIDAIPVPDPALAKAVAPLPGEIPDPTAPPVGCRFCTRCPLATRECHRIEPELVEYETGHWMACHRHAELPFPA